MAYERRVESVDRLWLKQNPAYGTTLLGVKMYLLIALGIILVVSLVIRYYF